MELGGRAAAFKYLTLVEQIGRRENSDSAEQKPRHQHFQVMHFNWTSRFCGPCSKPVFFPNQGLPRRVLAQCLTGERLWKPRCPSFGFPRPCIPPAWFSPAQLPSQAKLSQAEQSRAKLINAKPRKAKVGKAGQSQAKMSKAVRSKAKQSLAKLSKAKQS